MPNKNYCDLEDWIMPLLDEMLMEQKEQVSYFLVLFLFMCIFLLSSLLISHSNDCLLCIVLCADLCLADVVYVPVMTGYYLESF